VAGARAIARRTLHVDDRRRRGGSLVFRTAGRRAGRLARTSADLHLDPGEFAVPEGGERALFAVLAGKIEVVKTIDGIERRLGFRLPGTIFGEVPMALGTPFPGGYRAVEPSRVIRIEPQQYYAVAAVSKEISLKVSALAGRWSQRRDPYLLETSVPGVFACGDVRLSPVKRVASAVGEGSMAIALVRQYLGYEGHSDGGQA
jgi:CRP-like cAMP-binding protein